MDRFYLKCNLIYIQAIDHVSLSINDAINQLSELLIFNRIHYLCFSQTIIRQGLRIKIVSTSLEETCIDTFDHKEP